jgi:amino-acid N-acetyltransferase
MDFGGVHQTRPELMITIRLAEPADRDHVHRLVTGAGLPTEGLDDAWCTWVATAGGGIVGTASLERHRDALLLRGVAVDLEWQGSGIGTQLVTRALAECSDGSIALLTTTAAAWFARLGFIQVARGSLDPALASSPQLQGLCPDSATAMIYKGGGAPA